jgi:hypothetical protein
MNLGKRLAVRPADIRSAGGAQLIAGAPSTYFISRQRDRWRHYITLIITG